MAQEIEATLSAVQEELCSLPESFAENPQGKLLNLCAEFTACIKECTTGSEWHPKFFEGLYKEFEKLAKDIMGTRPNFEIPPKPAQKETSTLAAFPNTDYVSIPVPVPSSYSTPAAIAESESRTELEVKGEKSGPGQLFICEATEM